MAFKVFLEHLKTSLKIKKKNPTLVDFDKNTQKRHIFDIIWLVPTKLDTAETFKSMEKMLWDMDNAMQKTERQ